MCGFKKTGLMFGNSIIYPTFVYHLIEWYVKDLKISEK